MEKYKRILSYLPFVLSVCVSVYLTYLVDLTTLNSVLQRIFVFCFFALSVTVLLLLFRRYVGLDFNPKLIASAAVLSLTFIILFQGSFIPEKRESTVTFRAVVEDGSSHSGDVGLSEVALDGVTVPVSSLELVESYGWSYSSDLDDYVYYPRTGGSAENENALTFRIYSDSMSVIFAKNSWSGRVSYAVDSSDATVLELFSVEPSPEPVKLSLDLVGAESPLRIVLCALGAVTTVFTFAYQLLVIIDRTAKKRKRSLLTEKFADNILVFGIYCLLVTLLLEIFERVYDFSLLDITRVIGFFLLLALYPSCHRIIPMLRRLRVAEIILFLAVTFIITFQTVSEIIFMDIEKVTVGFIDIITFIIAMAVVAVPILEIILFVDKRTQKRFVGGEKNEEE